MPPFLPVINFNHSQSVRLGRGPGNAVASPLSSEASYPTSGIRSLFYVDLGQPEVRRDFQRHSAVGSVEGIGNASLTVYSDLFAVGAAPTVTYSGSNMTASVPAFTLQSRFYGQQLRVAPATVTLSQPSVALGGQWTYIVVNNAGVVSTISGPADSVAPTYEAWTVAVTGTAPTGGTFKLQFTYNGFLFTTATIAWNAAGSAVATAVQNATGGPNGSTFTQYTGNTAGDVAGSGTALPAGPAVVTFGGAVEGPVVPVSTDITALTGGDATTAAPLPTRTTQGVGVGPGPLPTGSFLVLGGAYVTSATANANAAKKLSTLTPTA